METLYPLLMQPAFRHMVWGGEKLKALYQKPLPENKIGESWEIACRDDLWSVVANGALKGQTLPEVFKKYGEAIIGRKPGKFPWLVKFIDASTPLSVQVHPDDSYAIPHGDVSGKTEMWYILQADPGAKLIVGFNRDTDRDEVIGAAKDGSIADMLNAVEVKAGDVFFIPPGTVHAIGAGIVILEIQQNSDATYRLYDWGRLGDDGKPRALHLEKAGDVAIMKKSAPKADDVQILPNGDELLASCAFFTVKRRKVTAPSEVSGFAAVIVLEGKVKIGTEPFQKGDSLLIPAALGSVPIAGSGEIVIVEEK